jgi:hypothetical protein
VFYVEKLSDCLRHSDIFWIITNISSPHLISSVLAPVVAVFLLLLLLCYYCIIVFVVVVAPCAVIVDAVGV